VLQVLLFVSELRSTIVFIQSELETLLLLELRGAAEGILPGEIKILHGGGGLLLFGHGNFGALVRLLGGLRHDDLRFFGHFSHG